MIIDIHYHVPRKREDWQGVLDVSRRNGVALSMASAVWGDSHYPSAEQIRHANGEARAFVDLAGPAARWLAYLNPQLDNWLAELETCLAEGACGIKLWCAFWDEKGRLDNCFGLLEEAGRRGLPVLIHTWNPTPGNAPGEISASVFADLARRFPETTLIAAHVGGSWWQGAAALARAGSNVYADVCGTAPDRHMVATLVDALGADRVVFGSDMPGRSQASQLTKVLFADIDEETKDKVLGGNILRIFGIDPNEVPKVAATEPGKSPMDVTEDYFCFSGRWPFFPLADLSPTELDDALARHAVTTAYVADLGSLFRIDLVEANRGFLAAAQGCRRVRPLAVVNPRALDWTDVLAEVSPDFAGVMVSPYLQGWQINDARYTGFFQSCAVRKLPLWVNCALHDNRVAYSGCAFRAPSAGELLDFAKTAPTNRYVFQGVTSDPMNDMLKLGRKDADFRFEISRLIDGNGQLGQILTAHGAGNLVHGSEYPFRDMRTVAWTAGIEANLSG